VSSSQKGQVFKLESGLWACRWRDASKRRRQRGGFRLKSDAQTVLDEELRRVRMGPTYQPKMTLNELVGKYLEQYDAAPASVEWLRYFLKFSQDRFGVDTLDSIDGHRVATWRASLRSDHEKHSATRALRQVLSAAKRWGWIDKDPTLDLKNTGSRAAEQRPFESWNEVDALAGEMSPRDAAILILAVGTGLRPEEYFALEWRDIDLNARTLTVHRAFAKGRLKDYPKTDRSRRTVPLRQRVFRVLAGVEDGWMPNRAPGVVFAGRGGKHLDLKSWRTNVWNIAFKTATGIERRTPYQCRHTYATWSIAAGVDLYTLARRMGTSLAMIDRTYGHLAINADAEERTKLDSWDGGAA
jgi:integrase